MNGVRGRSRRHAGRRRFLGAGLALLGLLLGRPSAALLPNEKEHAVKAAYLYNFLGFVTWPKEAFPSTDAPYRVGVVGRDPFDGALDEALRGKRVQGRAVRVVRFKSAKEIRSCHVLFVPDGEAKHAEAIRKATAKQAVLIVGETRDFARHTATINFYRQKGTIRFEINVDEAGVRGLQISSKLLKLARILRREKRGGAGG